MFRRAIPRAASPLLLLLALPVLAAPVPVGPKADETVAYPTAKLLQFRQVQKELKMTPEQRINLLDALEDIEELYEKQLDQLFKMPNAPDEAFDKADQERAKATRKALIAAAEKSLTAPQRARLRQLDWHIRGPAAFADPHIQKSLELTDAQKKSAADLADRTKAQAERYINDLGSDNEEKAKTEATTFRTDEVKKFHDTLTAAQKESWKTLLGEPIKGFNAHELWFKFIEDEEFDDPR